MKLLIASDIHGSAYYCRKLLGIFNAVQPDRMLLLGDLLYHGPRNDLPREYNPKDVITMLNAIADKLLCVRGNCEAEVDQMVLAFPIMAEYAVLYDGDRELFASHGHHITPENPPALPSGAVLLGGHTHVAEDRDCGHFRYLNPGSVSIPKGGTERGCLLYENGQFTSISLED
ncbi:MAG: phosphodiesterase [Ruminococcaceae bacterium]|nr:phosphodiesterase [Oscillospiraceae bacterium]